MERWSRRGTWVRFGVLFICYLLIPVITGWMFPASATTSDKAAGFITLLAVFPLATIALAAWDGVAEGFTILWTFLPILFFVAPMFIFFNESALIYGATYSVLAMVANGIGSLFRPKPHNTNKPRES